MAQQTTLSAEVAAFLAAVEPAGRRADAEALAALFAEVTGWAPKLWGSIVGYGSYHYRYESGREGDSLATGFAPRKANLVLYIMPGYQEYGPLLDRLGKHKIGKSCLYLGALASVDTEVLKVIIRAGLDDLAKRYPVTPS
ncbi:DUF1801 domain-containing protein [Pseudoroseicyclus sp. CXY001]|uniref:DUF1801 domain-containing protein n=1 Tax=Pseudoroseicyclus sp. CXY001 TaxID=3242492 RepID=UPI00358DD133